MIARVSFDLQPWSLAMANDSVKPISLPITCVPLVKGSCHRAADDLESRFGMTDKEAIALMSKDPENSPLLDAGAIT